MTVAYHCELAWLGDDHRQRRRADRGRRRSHRHRHARTPRRPPARRRCRGLTLPGLANAHSHAFHRALRGRTHDGVGSFWTWREQMYALAATLDPTTYQRLARAVFAEMALAGITVRRRVPLPAPSARRHAVRRPQRDGRGADRRGRRGRHPHHAARRLLPARRHRPAARTRCSNASATAASSSGASASTRCGRRRRRRCAIGAAIHSVRAVDPDAIQAVAAWAIERGCRCTPTCPSSRPRTTTASRRSADADRAAGRTQRARGRVHRSARHAPDRSRHAPAGRPTGARCACARRPSATWPTASGRRSACARPGVALSLGSDSHAVIDLFEEARAVELDERLVAQVRGNHLVTPLLAVGDRQRAPLPRLARRRPVGRRRPGRPGHRRPRQRAHRRQHAGARAGHRRVRRQRRRRAARRGRREQVVVVDGRHVSIDVAAELAESIDAAWAAASMSTTVIDNIGLLVTNDPSLGDGPARPAPRRRGGDRRRAGRGDRAGRRRRRPTHRRRGTMRDPRLRRQPHPPRLRRRPQRRVRRAHGRRAVRGGRHPHLGRRDPSRDRCRAAAR